MRRRRRRHDPLGPATAPSSRPRRARSTSTRTRPAPTASCTPAGLVAAAFAAGVRLFSLTDHDTLAGYRDVMAAGGAAAGHDPHARRGDQRPRDARPRACGKASSTSSGSAWTRTTRRSRRPSPPSATSAAHRFGQTVDLPPRPRLPIDAHVAALDPGDDDALGRPTIARALDRRRVRRRASRTPSTGSSGTACPATSVATASGRRMRSRPIRDAGGIAGPRPLPRGRDPVGHRCASSSTSGSAASRSTTGASMPRPRSGGRGGRRRARPPRDRRHGLPRRPRAVRRGARAPVGAARGRRDPARRPVLTDAAAARPRRGDQASGSPRP